MTQLNDLQRHLRTCSMPTFSVHRRQELWWRQNLDRERLSLLDPSLEIVYRDNGAGNNGNSSMETSQGNSCPIDGDHSRHEDTDERMQAERLFVSLTVHALLHNIQNIQNIQNDNNNNNQFRRQNQSLRCKLAYGRDFDGNYASSEALNNDRRRSDHIVTSVLNDGTICQRIGTRLNTNTSSVKHTGCKTDLMCCNGIDDEITVNKAIELGTKMFLRNLLVQQEYGDSFPEHSSGYYNSPTQRRCIANYIATAPSTCTDNRGSIDATLLCKQTFSNNNNNTNNNYYYNNNKLRLCILATVPFTGSMFSESNYCSSMPWKSYKSQLLENENHFLDKDGAMTNQLMTYRSATVDLASATLPKLAKPVSIFKPHHHHHHQQLPMDDRRRSASTVNPTGSSRRCRRDDDTDTRSSRRQAPRRTTTTPTNRRRPGRNRSSSIRCRGSKPNGNPTLVKQEQEENSEKKGTEYSQAPETLGMIYEGGWYLPPGQHPDKVQRHMKIIECMNILHLNEINSELIRYCVLLKRLSKTSASTDACCLNKNSKNNNNNNSINRDQTTASNLSVSMPLSTTQRPDSPGSSLADSLTTSFNAAVTRKRCVSPDLNSTAPVSSVFTFDANHHHHSASMMIGENHNHRPAPIGEHRHHRHRSASIDEDSDLGDSPSSCTSICYSYSYSSSSSSTTKSTVISCSPQPSPGNRRVAELNMNTQRRIEQLKSRHMYEMKSLLSELCENDC